MAKANTFTTLKKDKLIEELEQGTTIKSACGVVGVTTQTYYYHIDKDEDFKNRAEEAKRKADAQVEKSLFQTAIEGNVKAIKYWLTNRNPEDWGDKSKGDGEQDLDRYVKALLENAGD